MIMVMVSHSQSLEIVWQKQLAANEKFLAVSRDGKNVILSNVADGTISLWDVSTNTMIDSLGLLAIVSADFSPSGNHVVCGSNEYLYLLSLKPLRIEKTVKIQITYEINGDIEIVYSMENEYKMFCGIPIRISQTWSYIEGGYIKSVDFSNEKVENISQFYEPSHLQITSQNGSLLYYARVYNYEDYPGQPAKYSSEEFTYMYNRKTSKIHHRISNYKKPMFFYDDNYVIYQDCYVDFYNYIEKKIQPMLSPVFSVIYKSPYIVESNGLQIFLRHINSLHDRTPVLGANHECVDIRRTRYTNSFVTISQDSIVRICRLQNIGSTDSVSIAVNFEVKPNGIHSGSSVQFINSSFPLSENCKYVWDFGDGTTSTERNPVHIYNEQKYYSVRLTVIDDYNRSKSIEKKNVVFVISNDTNIVNQKKYTKNGFKRVKFSSDGTKITMSNSKSSYVIDKNTFLPLDSTSGTTEFLFPIVYRSKEAMLHLSKFKETINPISMPNVLSFDISVKDFNSGEIIHKTKSQLNFPSTPSYIENTNFDVCHINDSLFAIDHYSEDVIPYNVPEVVKLYSYKVFNIYDSLFSAPLDAKWNSTVIMKEDEYIDESLVYTPNGLKQVNDKTIIKTLSFQNVRDIKRIDSNHYLILTKDFATPVLLCNVERDTLHLFRSTNTPQSCIDINPINNKEFVTADTLGNVLLWKIPKFREKLIKPFLVNISAVIKKNTLDTLECLVKVYPYDKSGTYIWDFGDGTTANSPKATHCYKYAGKYSIKLRYFVKDIIDTVFDVTSIVTVKFSPLLINFYSVDTVQNKDAAIQFYNRTLPLHSEFKYVWDFGDGTKSTEIYPVHTYKSEGKFNVTLVVQRPNLSDTVVTKKNYITINNILSTTVFKDENRDIVSPTFSSGQNIQIQSYTGIENVVVYSLDGAIIRHWQYIPEGMYRINWELDDDKGNRVAPGMYYVVFRKEAMQQTVFPVMILW